MTRNHLHRNLDETNDWSGRRHPSSFSVPYSFWGYCGYSLPNMFAFRILVEMRSRMYLTWFGVGSERAVDHNMDTVGCGCALEPQLQSGFIAGRVLVFFLYISSLAAWLSTADVKESTRRYMHARDQQVRLSSLEFQDGGLNWARTALPTALCTSPAALVSQGDARSKTVKASQSQHVKGVFTSEWNYSSLAPERTVAPFDGSS